MNRDNGDRPLIDTNVKVGLFCVGLVLFAALACCAAVWVCVTF